MKIILATMFFFLTVSVSLASDKQDYTMAPPLPKNFNTMREKIRQKRIKDKNRSPILNKNDNRNKNQEN